MKLSIIVASRNDDHGERLTERTNLFIDTLVQQAEKYKLDGELIIVEWNPPADKKRLAEELSWPQTPAHFPVRVITVPHELHDKLHHSNELPFFQMIAKNVGARRARGDFLLFTNIDILLSDEMVEYLASAKLDNRTVYRADRHDTMIMPPMHLSVKDRLTLCRKDVFEVWKRRPRVDLHLVACGDFTLVGREVFAEACGHYEFEGFSIHVDSVLCYRLVDALGCAQEILPYPIYHIDHEDKYTQKLLDEVKGKGIPAISATTISVAQQAHLMKMAYLKYAERIEDMPHSGRWGLPDAPLQEWRAPVVGRETFGLTIFTCPKSFGGAYGRAQRNAIKSWLRLEPKPEIIIFGGEEVAGEFSACRCLPHVERNKYGTPLVPALWAEAERLARGNVLCYVNADIILLQDWMDSMLSISLPEFLAIGKRWDWRKPAAIDFGSATWAADLAAEVKRDANNLHTPAAVDYFAFTRGMYGGMPPFALGRTGWDNWLVNEPLRIGVPVVDATEQATAIHQNHTYGKDGELSSRDIWEGPEALENKALVGFFWASIDQATHKLTERGLEHKACIPYNNPNFMPKPHKPDSTETVEVDGKSYFAYLNRGNAKKFIEHQAAKFCIGRGLDVGAGKWPIRLPHGTAEPVDFGRRVNDAVSLLGVGKNSLDFIFSSHCLEHLADWKGALRRWQEVLRPGGMLFLYLPHPSFKPWNPGGAWVSGHMWKPEHDALCGHLRGMGFELLESDAGPDTYMSFFVAARKPLGREACVKPPRPEQREVGFVVPVRNESDNYIMSLIKFVDKLFAQAATHGLAGELVVVEWNPPEGRESIRDAIYWNRPAWNQLPIKILTVPRACHDIIFSDKPRGMYPYMAMNVGAAHSGKAKLLMVKDIGKPVDIQGLSDVWSELDTKAFWCDDNYLIVDRERFAQTHGFIEIAQETNQVRWLKELLSERGVELVDQDGQGINIARTENPPGTSDKANCEMVTTNRRRDSRAANGTNWGMKYDVLSVSHYLGGRESNPARPRRIAFVLTAGMGDMLLAIPTVKALAGKYPGATIDWVTHEKWVELVPTQYANPVPVPFSRGLQHLEPWLREHADDYDEIHIAMGFQRRIINAYYKAHMMDCVAAWSGVELSDRTIDVDASSADVSRFSLPAEFAAVCTSPCYSCNNWPVDHRNAVIAYLGECGLPIVAIGGKDGERLPSALNLCGELSPKETIAVIEKAALYIGPDNGCSWLACAAHDTPKLCFIDHDRIQIPVGFEGYTLGKTRDVKYDAPESEWKAAIDGLLKVKTSAIICARNSSNRELRKLQKVAKNNIADELIVVEWNPPPRRKLLKDACDWPDGVRIVTVPARLHDTFQDSGKCDTFPFMAMNVGARRAKYGRLALIFAPGTFVIPSSAQTPCFDGNNWLVSRKQFIAVGGFLETATMQRKKNGWLRWAFARDGITVYGADSKILPVPKLAAKTDGIHETGEMNDVLELARKKCLHNNHGWGLKWNRFDGDEPEKILIALTGGIGDVICGIPAARSLVEKYPDARIDWLVNDKCLSFVPSGVTAIPHGFDRNIDKLAGWLDLHAGDYDCVCAAMCGLRSFRTTHYGKPVVDLIAAWCGVDADRDIALPETGANVGRFGLPKSYVAICTSPSYSCKRWKQERMRALVGSLMISGENVMLVGGNDGVKLDGATSALGASLPETLEIIRGAKLYVGPDTGITWLACMAKTPKLVALAREGRIRAPVGFSHMPGKIKELGFDMTDDKFFKEAKRLMRKRPPAEKKRRVTIDVGLIVLNGEPWLEAWLQAYGGFADRIVVVEGVDNRRFASVPRAIRDKLVTPDGHSTDRTREILDAADVDAELVVVTRDGGWADKNAMFAEMSKYLYSDYVFEIDVDEFWFEKDLARIRKLLEANPDVGTWWSKPMNFWKGARWHTDPAERGCWWNDGPVLFKWEHGRTLIHQPRHVEPPINAATEYLPFDFFHYNYVMASDAEYKRHYHNEMPDWYEKVWKLWTPKNRIDLTRGVQPGGQLKTSLVEYTGKHPRFAANVLAKLAKEGIILA